MIHAALWVAAVLFLSWVALSVLSRLLHWRERRALQRLKDAYAKLTPEQKASRTAQRVEWYFNLPKAEQTKETWEWVQSADRKPPTD